MANYPHLGLRVFLGPDSVLCSTKAELLQSISETGSIAAAGRRMGMSYKRAWYLINTLNDYFNEPVVVSVKGGPQGGGASLTKTGEAVLSCYLSLKRKSEAAASADLKRLASLSTSSRAQKAI